MSSPLVEPTYYYKDIEEIGGGDGVWDFDLRWPDVQQWADFRPDDVVLDLGCAEGLVALEVAPLVQQVRGVELRSQRVEAAIQIAQERGAANVTFECASVVDIELAERSYDVVLFLGVYQHLEQEKQQPTLEKALAAARRQVLMRMPLFDRRFPERAMNLVSACQRQGFSLTFYPRAKRGGNLMIANRCE